MDIQKREITGMQLTMYEYIEVNLVGVVLLLTMLLYARGRRLGIEQRDFRRMLLCNMLILLADNGIYLLRGHSAPGLIALNHLVCIAYFSLNGLFCYNWVRYVLARLYPRYRLGRRTFWLLLPALASAAFVASSPLTGWAYTIDSGNEYHRGPLLLVLFLAAIVYWLFSTALVLREYLYPTRSREKAEYRTLFAFPLPMLIGNLLQLRFYGLSIVWVLASLSMLILFIDMQNAQLTRDALTGLYNRRQTNSQLAWEIAHLHSSPDLLLAVMFDVDHFKKINDRYGHLAGDSALTLVARTIRDNCRKSDFASRFGGDEFLLIGHIRSAEDAESLIRRISGALEAESRSGALPFAVTMSAGCALFSSADQVTMDDVLNRADRSMYEVKRRARGDEEKGL
jgi:diguanylate cyclase (GGDEF)-like protein